MNTFDYHVVMESFTEMAARNIDMTGKNAQDVFLTAGYKQIF